MGRDYDDTFDNARGPWFLYVVYEQGSVKHGPTKVGTAINVKYRVDGLRHGNWRELVIRKTFQVKDRGAALALEKRVHQHFHGRRLFKRDWFLCAPDDLIAFIEAHI